MRIKTHSTMAISAHIYDWLLDSAAFFYMTKERPVVVNKSQSGEKVIAAIKEVIKSVSIGLVLIGQMNLKDV